MPNLETTTAADTANAGSVKADWDLLRADMAEVIVEPEKPEIKPEIKPEEVDLTVTKPEDKPEVKPESKQESKAPNDPAELRKWNTRVSQENAALRDEMKAIKTAIEKLSKKPIDYKELAKNPESIQKQIELEREEAVAEMQDKLVEVTTRAVAKETEVERIKREQDAANYPDWKRVFPLIQNLAANTDGRVNFNQAPAVVLDALYDLALQLSPSQIANASVTEVKPEVKPAIVGKTPEEIAVDIAAAEKRGFEKAQESLRAEQNGAGIGSAGKGGRRSSGLTKEALMGMSKEELKKLISKE